MVRDADSALPVSVVSAKDFDKQSLTDSVLFVPVTHSWILIVTVQQWLILSIHSPLFTRRVVGSSVSFQSLYLTYLWFPVVNDWFCQHLLSHCDSPKDFVYGYSRLNLTIPYLLPNIAVVIAIERVTEAVQLVLLTRPCISMVCYGSWSCPFSQSVLHGDWHKSVLKLMSVMRNWCFKLLRTQKHNRD